MYMLNFCDCVQCFKIGALYLLKTAYRPRVYLRIHVQYRAVICLFYTYTGCVAELMSTWHNISILDANGYHSESGAGADFVVLDAFSSLS